MKLKSILTALFAIMAFASSLSAARPNPRLTDYLNNRRCKDTLAFAKLTVAERYEAACAEAVEKNLPLVVFVGRQRDYGSLDGQAVVARVNTMVGYVAPTIAVFAPCEECNGGLCFVAQYDSMKEFVLPKKRTVMRDCETGTCRAVQTYFPTCQGGSCSGPESCGAGGNCSTCPTCQAARRASGAANHPIFSCRVFARTIASRAGVAGALSPAGRPFKE